MKTNACNSKQDDETPVACLQSEVRAKRSPWQQSKGIFDTSSLTLQTLNTHHSHFCMFSRSEAPKASDFVSMPTCQSHHRSWFSSKWLRTHLEWLRSTPWSSLVLPRSSPCKSFHLLLHHTFLPPEQIGKPGFGVGSWLVKPSSIVNFGRKCDFWVGVLFAARQPAL